MFSRVAQTRFGGYLVRRSEAPSDESEIGPPSDPSSGSLRPTAPGSVTRAAALSVLPAALILYLAFSNGGYFPAATAWVAAALAALLAVRLLTVPDALTSFGWAFRVVAGSLALLALWTVASAAWSGAPARAVTEFDRTILYLLAFVLFASVGNSPGRLVWLVRGLACGILAVALSALAARLLPELWPFGVDLAPYGLEYPVGYPNALGLLVGVGLLLCVYLASSPAEPRFTRLMAVASVPPLATVLLLTRSLGAAVVTITALALFAYFARRSPLGRTAVALVPTTAIALSAAFDASVLATADASSPHALAQGRMVAVVVALCSANAALLHWVLWRGGHRLTGATLRRSRAAAVAAGVGVLAVVGLGGVMLSDQSSEHADPRVREGAEAESPRTQRDRRAKTARPTALEARALYWGVAGQAFAEAPVRGRGAGTYEFLWERLRPRDLPVTDAHSLPLETIAELGVVGLALLLTALSTLLVATGRAARETDNLLYVLVLCIGSAWVAHALVDWDWEMPVVTLPLFALGGAALACRRAEAGSLGLGRSSAHGESHKSLRHAATACLITASLALAGASGWLARLQEQLDRAAESYRQGDCPAATRHARCALSLSEFRPEPHEVLGLCALRNGRGRAAEREMEEAAEREPANWEHEYGRALAQDASRRNPLGAVAAARRRNPRERLLRSATRERFPSFAELERRRGPQPLDY